MVGGRGRVAWREKACLQKVPEEQVESIPESFSRSWYQPSLSFLPWQPFAATRDTGKSSLWRTKGPGQKAGKKWVWGLGLGLWQRGRQCGQVLQIIF